VTESLWHVFWCTRGLPAHPGNPGRTRKSPAGGRSTPKSGGRAAESRTWPFSATGTEDARVLTFDELRATA
jgi:hypothetical protein